MTKQDVLNVVDVVVALAIVVAMTFMLLHLMALLVAAAEVCNARSN